MSMMPTLQSFMRWMLVLWVYLIIGNDGIAAEESCTNYGCCEMECCGENTSWDETVEYCVRDLGAPGFDLNLLQPESIPICQVRICCEDSCCFEDTYYDPSIQCCLPLTIPTEPPVAPTPSPTLAPADGSDETVTEAPTQVVLLPSPAFRPNVCGTNLTDAANYCSTTTTCSQAEIGEECYDPCDFFGRDPATTCPKGLKCFSFVSGCKDFAPSFPNVPFDPSINP